MDYDMLMALVRPDLLIIAVVLFCLGKLIKTIPNVPNWTIPFYLSIMSIALTLVYVAIVLGEGFTDVVLVTSFVQGILVSSIAVYGNEAIKQAFKGVEDNEEI